jgi:hypothetical protein
MGTRRKILAAMWTLYLIVALAFWVEHEHDNRWKTPDF